MRTTRRPFSAIATSFQLASFVALAACGNAATDPASTSEQPAAIMKTPAPHPQGIVSSTFPCQQKPVYNGGALMTGEIALYPIFYGTAWQPGYQTAILQYLATMSQTSYWQIVEEYTQKSNGLSPGAVTVEPAINMTSYSEGKALTETNIQQIAQSAISSARTAPTTSSIYMVFTADDVDQTLGNEGAFCSAYQGWHTQAKFTWTGTLSDQDPVPVTENVTTQFAFVGSQQFCLDNPDIQPIVCAEDAGPGPNAWNQTANGSGPPNGEVADMAITTAFHEAAESATDPDTHSGVSPEIGDICAWEPGPLTFSGSPSFYVNSDLGDGEPYSSSQVGFSDNSLGDYSYLVQTLWDINQDGCAYGPAYDDASKFHRR